jgi:hypothetical protein
MASLTINSLTLARGIFEPDGVSIGQSSGQISSTNKDVVDGSLQRVFYTATASDENAIPVEWSASNYNNIYTQFQDADNDTKQELLLSFINPITGSRGYGGITRINANGYAQLLFLDVYPAFGFSPTNGNGFIGNPNYAGPIVLYFHGGGFNSGVANFYSSPDESINQFRRAGFHCISVEYRRGWGVVTGSLFGLSEQNSSERLLGVTADLKGYYLTDQGQIPPTISEEAGGRFLQTALGTNGIAMIDCIDAWDWVDRNIQTLLPNAIKKYVLQGNSAGGSLTAQLSFANDLGSAKLNRLEKKLIGSIESFGSYTASVSIDNTIRNREIPYPIIMQSAGFDKLVPYRDNHLFYQTNLPYSKGTYDQYITLSESGKYVYWYNTPTGQHGYDSWSKTFNLLGTKDLRETEYINWAIKLINKKIGNETLPPPHWLTRIGTILSGLEAMEYPTVGYYTNLSAESASTLYTTNSMWFDIQFNTDIQSEWFYTSSFVEDNYINQSVHLLISASTSESLEYLVSESARLHTIANQSVGTDLIKTNTEDYISNYGNVSILHWGDAQNTGDDELRTLAEISTSIANHVTSENEDPFV